MSVQEACEYLKMPLSTFYYKVKNDGLPAIKQGKHLLIYRDARQMAGTFSQESGSLDSRGRE